MQGYVGLANVRRWFLRVDKSNYTPYWERATTVHLNDETLVLYLKTSSMVKLIHNNGEGRSGKRGCGYDFAVIRACEPKSSHYC